MTNATAPLLKAALEGLQSIYEKGVIYKKLGVQANELLPVNLYDQDLFAETENPKHSELSKLIDKINKRYGRNKIYYSTLGAKRDWLPQDNMRSSRYTTNMNELLVVS